MSLSFWVITTLVIGGCTFIFKKAVSNDSKNDYRIRDILTHSSEQESHTSNFSNKKEYNESSKESVLVGARNKEFDNEENTTNNYSTVTHENYTNNINPSSKSESITDDTDYYEKINDDACEYDTEENGYDDDELNNYDDSRDSKEESYFEKTDTKQIFNLNPKRSFFDYIKTFWHGITFSVGILVCIYSFIGIATQVQTSNDAIVYSIWLLIGVILIK